MISQSRTPRPGDFVLFQLDTGPSTGQYRPAIIVRTWAEPPDAPVQLQVFTDSDGQSNDHMQPLTWQQFRTRGPNPGQWLYPDEVSAIANGGAPPNVPTTP